MRERPILFVVACLILGFAANSVALGLAWLLGTLSAAHHAGTWPGWMGTAWEVAHLAVVAAVAYYMATQFRPGWAAGLGFGLIQVATLAIGGRAAWRDASSADAVWIIAFLAATIVPVCAAAGWLSDRRRMRHGHDDGATEDAAL